MTLNLASETAIVTAGMGLLCALPVISSRVRGLAPIFILMGTGAMIGLCLFDLLPDVHEMGGMAALALTLAVWLGYSMLHLFQLDRHHHSPDAGVPGITPSPFFLISLMAHCVASGMLLVVSGAYTSQIRESVYAALLIHKGYEALTVSSVLVMDGRVFWRRNLALVLYCLSFPAGVALSLLCGKEFSRQLALWISATAVGTLLSCLIFDFLIPAYEQLRRRRSQLGWIVLGLAVTQLVMRNLSSLF